MYGLFAVQRCENDLFTCSKLKGFSTPVNVS